MRSLKDKAKTHWMTAFCLIMVLLIAPGGMSFAAPPAADDGPQELRVTERDAGQAVDLNGEVLVLYLESNPSTGYGWQVQGLDTQLLRQLDTAEWAPHTPDKPGAPGTQILRFAAIGRGQTTLNLVYARPWETAAAPLKSFSLDVQVIEPSANVVEPIHAGEELAAAAPEAASPDVVTPDAVPAAYNWCSKGGCTPVRDQASCGSCWAFATVGPLESAILLRDGVSSDLSEQYLVSCNSDGWGCDGGWWAHDYHEWKFLAAQPGAGARYESDFPYTATDATCMGPYNAHEKIADWVYVGNSSSVPTTAAIKQAIYDHGPISAGVCVNSAFQAYTGGVFSPTGWCFSINHGIVLVGWDDSVGAWILRNSWGPEWGEDGYMRIVYGKSYVGYAAAYVVYNGSTPPAPPTAPTGLAATAVSHSQVNLAWTDNADNETGYTIERCTGASCSDFAQIATAGANATSYSNTGLTASTSYSYRVRAYNAGGDSGYSDAATAVTQAPPAGAKLYLGSSTSGTAGGVAFADEDVLIKDMGTGAWALFIDGSDIGLANTDVDAFELQGDGSLLMSFDTDFSLYRLRHGR